jgi:hypothetical protein
LKLHRSGPVPVELMRLSGVTHRRREVLVS